MVSSWPCREGQGQELIGLCHPTHLEALVNVDHWALSGSFGWCNKKEALDNSADLSGLLSQNSSFEARCSSRREDFLAGGRFLKITAVELLQLKHPVSRSKVAARFPATSGHCCHCRSCRGKYCRSVWRRRYQGCCQGISLATLVRIRCCVSAKSH